MLVLVIEVDVLNEYKKSKQLASMLIAQNIPAAVVQIWGASEWNPNFRLAPLASKIFVIAKDAKVADEVFANNGLLKLFEDGTQCEFIDASKNLDNCFLPTNHMVEEKLPVMVAGYLTIIGKMYRMLLAKNSDYSSANMLLTGDIGAITRLWDKMARLLNLSGFEFELVGKGSFKQEHKPKFESILDTLLDMANYAIIALLLRMNVWGK